MVTGRMQLPPAVSEASTPRCRVLIHRPNRSTLTDTQKTEKGDVDHLIHAPFFRYLTVIPGITSVAGNTIKSIDSVFARLARITQWI